MKTFSLPAMLTLLALVGCGSPLIPKSSNNHAPADPNELIVFPVTAGNWTLQLYGKRQSGQIAAESTTQLAPATAAFSFGPAVTMPFAGSQRLPLVRTLEEISCADAQAAVSTNGTSTKLEGNDTYLVKYDQDSVGNYFATDVVALDRDGNCALLTYQNGTPGKAALGPLPAETALTIYAEASTAKFHK